MSGKIRLLLAIVCAVAVASVYIAQPLLESMGRSLGMSEAATGWLVATGHIGYVVGLVLLVPLGDIVRRRLLIPTQLALTGVGLLMTAFAPAVAVVFAGLALAGVFAVVVQTAVAYAAAASPPNEQGRSIGAVTSGVVVGILGGRALAGALAEAVGWQGVYFAFGVAAIALAVAAAAMLPREHRVGGGRSYPGALRGLAHLFSQRSFLSSGLIAFFAFASFGTLWSGMSLPLAEQPWSMGETAIGMLSLVGLAGAVGAARAGRWADAGKGPVVMCGALALLIVSWLAISQLTWSLGFLLVGILVLDFAVQSVHVSNQHRLTSTYPMRASAVIGGYMVFYSLGSALGASATTALYSIWGWSASSVLGAGFAVCALVVWVVGALQHRRQRIREAVFVERAD